MPSYFCRFPSLGMRVDSGSRQESSTYGNSANRAVLDIYNSPFDEKGWKPYYSAEALRCFPQAAQELTTSCSAGFQGFGPGSELGGRSGSGCFLPFWNAFEYTRECGHDEKQTEEGIGACSSFDRVRRARADVAHSSGLWLPVRSRRVRPRQRPARKRIGRAHV